jgi:photosystem II stability/assembly factor-like uncharacterized protein
MNFLMASVAGLGLALAADGPWMIQQSGSISRLRGLSVVSDEVAWASGSQGTCLRTIDAGRTWNRSKVTDLSTLDFRDIQALDDQLAYVLSIGPGELSRIYKTLDGGQSWKLQFINRNPKGFLDAVAFWDKDHGLALGDPVDGRYEIFRTDDGGETWLKIADSGMPESLPGEGAFAASGTCLVVLGTENAWFGTGGGATARVFRSTDRGRTWSVANSPIRAGIASAGIFSIAFRDPDHGLAVGGDYKELDNPTANFAVTTDGGRTWKSVGASRPSGFRSAVAFLPGEPGRVLTVGPSGSDFSKDGGQNWLRLEGPGFDSIGVSGSGQTGWASGEKGRIGRFTSATLIGR